MTKKVHGTLCSASFSRHGAWQQLPTKRTSSARSAWLNIRGTANRAQQGSLGGDLLVCDPHGAAHGDQHKNVARFWNRLVFCTSRGPHGTAHESANSLWCDLGNARERDFTKRRNEKA